MEGGQQSPGHKHPAQLSISNSSVSGQHTTQQQGFDYQQYTKQYAGQYMQGGQSGSSSGGKQGGNYQQYMKQYAGKYMQGGSSNGSQQGGDYQQYMKQYAGQYMQGHKNGSHATSQQGGDYQQYMKQYAGQYMKGHQNDSHVRSQQSSQATAALPREDFQKHQHQQGGPSEYQHDVAIANNSHLLSKHVAADQHTLPEFRSHNLSEAARNQSGNLRGSSPAAMRLASSEATSSHTHQISMRFLAIVVPTFIAVSLFAVRRRRINSQVEEDCYYVEVDGDNLRAGEYQAPHLTS